MATNKVQPIVVIRKKSGHGGHHGGAWKVAYADFVTAMMALFIVLWLMNSSEKVRKAVAGYFNDPKGTASLLGTTMSGTGGTVQQAIPDTLRQLKARLEQEIKERKDLAKQSKQIEITMTPEGLRIELLEGKNGTFYQSGSAELSPRGQELLTLLASELKTLPNSLLIEGHTDSAPYSQGANYSNWELSADRANAARRLMQQAGVRQNQVTQVRGYADQMLRVKSNPYDPSNRRISILVKSDGHPIPDLKGASVMNDAAPASPGGQQSSDGKAAQASAAGNGAKPERAPGPAQAQTKPSAAGPGFLGKLKGGMPGSKE